jgi:two-component system response regulator BaeR
MSSAAKILIVEDEAKLAAVLRDYLEQSASYTTHWVDRGDTAMDAFIHEQPDLVLLDLMLPGLDGLEVCKAIRAVSDTPVIVITARVEEIDRLLGLELGADDYICKPFSPREVVARVKAVLRRANTAPDSRVPGGLLVDEEKHAANYKGTGLKLTPVEFSLLAHLAKHPGQIFSRNQLMNIIYPDYRIVSDRTVDTHVKNLRQRLADVAPGEQIIESVYGMGYRLAD